jgi:hypothetical protein
VIGTTRRAAAAIVRAPRSRRRTAARALANLETALLDEIIQERTGSPTHLPIAYPAFFLNPFCSRTSFDMPEY